MNVDLKFPFLGQFDALAQSLQPNGTTTSAQNMRGLDGSTGRFRGSQRSGLSKFCDDALGSPLGPIENLVVDTRKIAYANLIDSGAGADASVEQAVAWSADLPSKLDLKTVCATLGDDLVVVDGTNLLVYNSSGVKVTTFAIPLVDKAQVCRALHADEFGNVYVGVSSGGPQEKARVFGLRRNDDNGFELLWTLKPQAFVVSIDTRAGKLYWAQNRPDRGRSEVVAWGETESAVPEQLWSTPVSYPANCLSAKLTGEIVFTSEPNDFRGVDPKYPTFSTVTKGGFVIRRDLANYSERAWSHYRADSVNGLDSDGNPNPLPADGDEVTVWSDISGNGRDLFVNADTGMTAPTFRTEVGPGGPGIHFSRTDKNGNTVTQGLISGRNMNTSPDHADQQKTIYPAYSGAQCAVFVSCRPSVSSVRGVIIGQDAAASTTPHDKLIIANRKDTNAATAGWVKVNEPQDVEGGGSTAAADGFAPAYDFDNENSWLIAHAIFDGGVGNSDSYPWATVTKSLFRGNGTPTDRWASEDDSLLTMQASEVGRFVDAIAQGYFEGDIVEILVLHEQALTEPRILTHQFSPEGVAWSTPAADPEVADDEATEQEKIEGAMAHEAGVAHLLDSASFAHPYHSDLGAPTADGSPINVLNNVNGVLGKLSSAGELIWAVSDIGGIGYACKAAPDGAIYTMGPLKTTSVADNYIYRRVKDNGRTASVTGTGTWRADPSSGSTLEDHFPIIATDEASNAYFPFTASVTSDDDDHTFAIYNVAGTRIAYYETPRTALSNGPARQSYGVAIPAAFPKYQAALTNDRAEFVYVALKADTGGVDQLKRVNMVEVTNTTGSPRTFVQVVAAGGSIKTITAGVVATPSGGANCLDPNSEFISSCNLFGDAYFADGKGYFKYDHLTDTVAPFNPTSHGKIPPRCRIIAAWGGRLVLGRDADNPANWHMSAIGDPEDWNTFPAVFTDSSAVSGNDPRFGFCPDIINSIVAISDEMLLFLCDHSVYRMDGNPAAAGRFRLISDKTGGAYGKCACRDPEGNVYFFGSRGGLWQTQPDGSGAQSLSRDKNERELSGSTFLNSFHVSLAWDTDEDGVRIYFIPFVPADLGSLPTNWFYERGGQFAPWPDVLASPDLLVTGVVEIDGDGPDDRFVVVGCVDGYLRKIDRAAVSDDGVPIDSNVLLGPYSMKDQSIEAKLLRVQVTLGAGQGGATMHLYASDSVDEPGIPVASWPLDPGVNVAVRPRKAAAFFWIGLQNVAADERWAFESGFMEVFPGRKRVPA